MTYREEKEQKEREAREEEDRRRASAKQSRIRELKAQAEQLEQARAEFYTPEKMKGNTSVQFRKKKLEEELDAIYDRLKELQG